jgi:hypothetical protein
VNGVFATVTIAGNCAELSSGMHLFFENGRIELDPCAWGNPPIKIWRDGKGQVRYPALEGEWITPNINFLEAVHGQGRSAR